MLPPLINISLFRAAIEQDILILTPNHRLAAQINHAWGLECKDSQTVWRTPRIFAMDHWLRWCWDELQDRLYQPVCGMTLLGEQQNLCLWERIIREYHPELNAKNYHRLASDTLSLLQRWDLSLEDIRQTTPGVQHVKQWATAFLSELSQKSLVTPEMSWQLIAESFMPVTSTQSILEKESTILLHGFQSIPPLQERVLRNACSQLDRIATTANRARAFQVEAVNEDRELRSALYWATRQIAENPDQRIGVVVPSLGQNLHKITRMANEALRENAVNDITVNISAGEPLSDTPIIGSALDILSMFRVAGSPQTLPLGHWLRLVYSPFWLFEKSGIAFRINSELALRALKQADITFGQFLSCLPIDSDEENSPIQALFKLKKVTGESTQSKRSFSDWADFFRESLHQMGWPGPLSLNSIEYQQQQQWNNLLEQFCQFDSLGQTANLSTALHSLEQICRETAFHPETPDSPLQILGLLESAGLRFDQLWVTGLHSRSFPAQVAINPLLPAEFQRRHNMPYALPERELEIASQLLESYLNNADQLICSYPRMNGEEVLEPSPLLRQFPTRFIHQLVAEHSLHPAWLSDRKECELINDTIAPAIQKEEHIPGGSTLLKNQSTCPFNAFAIHRLGADALEEAEYGLSPMDRGSILHDILYRLWRQWQNSATLHSLSETMLHNQVSQTINTVLQEWPSKNRLLASNAFKELEQQRLQKLVVAWLEEEKARPGFSVTGLETPVIVTFADLEISLRLDRIDSINGKSLIIDYKTGSVSPTSWMGERPLEPQLPLYLMASNPTADGCAFAQIRPGNIKLVGCSNAQLLPKEKPCENWEELLKNWEISLTQLADEFLQGYAAVEVHNANFSYHAHLLPLNRWPEQDEIKQLLEASR